MTVSFCWISIMPTTFRNLKFPMKKFWDYFVFHLQYLYLPTCDSSRRRLGCSQKFTGRVWQLGGNKRKSGFHHRSWWQLWVLGRASRLHWSQSRVSSMRRCCMSSFLSYARSSPGAVPPSIWRRNRRDIFYTSHTPLLPTVKPEIIHIPGKFWLKVTLQM